MNHFVEIRAKIKQVEKLDQLFLVETNKERRDKLLKRQRRKIQKIKILLNALSLCLSPH